MIKLYLNCNEIEPWIVLMSCNSWPVMHFNHNSFVLWLFSSLTDLIHTSEEKIALWPQKNETQCSDCSIIVFVWVI